MLYNKKNSYIDLFALIYRRFRNGHDDYAVVETGEI